MKKNLLSGAIGVCLVAACQTNGTLPDKVAMKNSLSRSAATENTQARPDMHTARLSLDVEGRYEVGKPVAGNDIREVRIGSGGRYVVTLANGIHVSGLYVWDASDNRIILDIKGEPCTFFVGENFLKIESAGKQKGRTFRKFMQVQPL